LGLCQQPSHLSSSAGRHIKGVQRTARGCAARKIDPCLLSFAVPAAPSFLLSFVPWLSWTHRSWHWTVHADNTRTQRLSASHHNWSEKDVGTVRPHVVHGALDRHTSGTEKERGTWLTDCVRLHSHQNGNYFQGQKRGPERVVSAGERAEVQDTAQKPLDNKWCCNRRMRR